MKKTAIAATLLLLCPFTFAQQPSHSKPSAVITAENVSPPAAESSPKLTTPAAASIASLPAGTEIHIRLETTVSTSTSKAGDPFAGRVIEDISYNGKIVIPVGSSVKGHVVRVVEQRRIHGRPYIELRPDRVVLPDGSSYAINAVVTDTSKSSQTSVDREGRIEGQGMDRRDKIEVAGATAAGVSIGAWKGGFKGSLIGAAIGGGGALVYWLTKRKSTALTPGTEVWIELDRPMALTSSSD